MEQNEMIIKGMEWNRMEWNGMEQNGMEQNGFSREMNGMEFKNLVWML